MVATLPHTRWHAKTREARPCAGRGRFPRSELGPFWDGPFPRVISMQCEVKLKGWEKAGPILAPAFWMGPAHQEMVSHKMVP